MTKQILTGLLFIGLWSLMLLWIKFDYVVIVALGTIYSQLIYSKESK